MAITDANTNTNQTLPYLPSLRPSLAPAQPQRASEDLPKPQVQDTVLGSTTAHKGGYLNGDDVRLLIDARRRGFDWEHDPSVGPYDPEREATEFVRRLKHANKGTCWRWEGAMKTNGYGCMYFNHKLMAAHRRSYILAKGPIPDGLFVCHQCDNPRCVNPDHLHLGTAADNSREAKERGRLGGIWNPNSKTVKLRMEDVTQIKQWFKAGTPVRRIAERFNVSISHVYRIKEGNRRQNW